MDETTRDEGNRLLYDRFTLTIFTSICRHVSHKQDAEDLLVEVFLAAFNNEALAGLPAERQLAWLRSIARNKVIDYYRHLAVLNLLPLEQVLEMEDTALSPEQSVEQQESYERLYVALERLSPLQRELLWLRYTKGLRFCEIAGILGKSEVAVRQLYSRTLRQLRGIYQQTEGGK